MRLLNCRFLHGKPWLNVFIETKKILTKENVNRKIRNNKSTTLLFSICEPPKRFPYDWKNPTGYLCSVAAVWLWGHYAFHYIASMVFLLVGVFMFAFTFTKDMKCNLYTINEMAKVKKHRKHMYKKLSKFVQTHANMKQLSGLSGRWCDLIAVKQFFWFFFQNISTIFGVFWCYFHELLWLFWHSHMRCNAIGSDWNRWVFYLWCFAVTSNFIFNIIVKRWN